MKVGRFKDYRIDELLPFDSYMSMVGTKYDCLQVHDFSSSVPLKPLFLDDVMGGIKEYFNSRLLIYDHSLDGQLMAYDTIRLMRPHGEIRYSDPRPYYSVNTRLIVMKPLVGMQLKGVVKMRSALHCCAIVYNCVQASIYLPKKYSNLDLNLIPLESTVIFDVTEIKITNCTLCLYGRLCKKSIRKILSTQVVGEDVNIYPPPKRSTSTMI
ncbi:DNA-directed RNA polymerase I subunit RPA43 [Thelohanellus kitauei]|uniref:DNA-directed RNA polymerase I subunit RPA43 n=1 Tax=Thelohanellus kitauei TaxID=669202 RepID=A0A0C2I6P9_THEKT|nr:DNA-directed RNA polymerase I subunit RPA43 [Thelohanellus kitauei]